MDNMVFGERLKKEREKRDWSQVDLAEKIYVSRQSISKWETGKNYPSIEVIIELSNLFDITIDELLRSDGDLKKKIIRDSKQLDFLNLKDYLMLIAGILSGIMLVSILKNGEVNWTVTGTTIVLSILGFFCILLIRVEMKKAAVKKSGAFVE